MDDDWNPWDDERQDKMMPRDDPAALKSRCEAIGFTIDMAFFDAVAWEELGFNQGQLFHTREQRAIYFDNLPFHPPRPGSALSHAQAVNLGIMGGHSELREDCAIVMAYEVRRFVNEQGRGHRKGGYAKHEPDPYGYEEHDPGFGHKLTRRVRDAGKALMRHGPEPRDQLEALFPADGTLPEKTIALVDQSPSFDQAYELARRPKSAAINNAVRSLGTNVRRVPYMDTGIDPHEAERVSRNLHLRVLKEVLEYRDVPTDRW